MIHPLTSLPSCGPDERHCPPGAPRARLGWWALLLVLLVAGSAAAAEPIHGLPFTRSYSLEDVGYGPRGANLGFDRFGRVTVVHDGVYAVLNDAVWQNLAAGRPTERVAMTNVVAGPDSRMYYGARGSWGEARILADGLLHARPLIPSDPPSWVHSAAFTELITTADGVYFVSPGGVVVWDVRTRTNQYFEHTRIARAFAVGREVYISAFDRPLGRVDRASGAIVTVEGIDLGATVVIAATELDAQRSLLSLLDGRLLVFNGRELSPWRAPHRGEVTGPVTVLRHLVDGHVAFAITGKGLLLFSPEGELVLSLDTPQYHRITALANREPGVMWVATEDGIEKVLYSSSLTTFGQQLGLTIGWPIIERCQGELFVVSEGHLYRAAQGSPGAPTRFELHPHQPPGGAWALATWGERMLVGSPEHVYAVAPDGRLQVVADVRDVAHLVMFDAEHCFAIGRSEIALLQWRDGAWVEAAARTRGVTYPSVVHRAKNSAWIEMGGQVGRLWLRDDRLQLDLVPNAPWTRQPWVNIGVVDDVVVLTGRPGERRFFDESRGTWCEAPRLRALLERSTTWVARMQKDDTGTIWATHDGGVIRFTPQGDDYAIDASTFDLINDRYPILHVLPGSDVWIFASQSLYHVEPRWTAAGRRESSPLLVSLVDARGRERLTSERDPREPFRIRFADNAVSLRFFSGTDAWRRAPAYEYCLSEREPWTPLAGSQLSLRGLSEGRYELRVRTQGRNVPAGPAASFPIEILPPWYRTWPAYLAYAAFAVVALVAVVRWSVYLERRRNRVLEQVVHERTRQLEETMARLGEETRNAATLAERDRLANEIHDSVQQGLTGAMLQLDSTLTLPVVPDEVRSRLNVVRNIVSYTRQEVQHAVWDMESPLLEGTELAEALRNLTTFASSGETHVEVSVSGEQKPLDRTTSHHLLRIAQEATTNAFRHAQAHRITIRLEYQPATVRLEIVDDGVGFRPGDVLQERVGHLGLRGIRTRVKKLGGTLDIASEPNGGTAIRVEVPLPSPQDSSPDAKAGRQ